MLKQLELALRQAFIRRLYGTSTAKYIHTPDTPLALAPNCRILLLRQDRIGDVIVSTPIMRTLREKYPEARIDILLGDNNFAVQNLALAYCNTVWRYSKSFSALLGLVRSLRRVRYDVVIDLIDNASVTSSLIIRAAGARFSVGIDKENAAAYSHVVPLLDRKEWHIVHRIAQLLLPFGIDPAKTSLELTYPLSKQDIHFAQARLPTKHRQYRLGINLSGRGAEMYWGRDNCCWLVHKMKSAFPAFEILLMGLPEYAAEAEAIRAATQTEGSVSIAPKAASLHEFAAMLHECDAVFTPDTSVVHLAAAWKRPTLVLFVFNEFGLAHWTPFQTPHRALVVSEESFQRGENAVRTIPREKVWQALTDLLNEQFIHSTKE
jgi:ADP-heptose:LPS heptosyltransferase